mgnify:CR=1 FL=1
MHPKQELYEISRLSDEFFNQMGKLDSVLAEFLKSIEGLRSKVNRELGMQKEKTVVKEEKMGEREYDLVVLRKISFKKEKTSLKNKLKDIDTINKQLLKVEAGNDA